MVRPNITSVPIFKPYLISQIFQQVGYSFRIFHDTIESHVCCLQSLGKSPESQDTLLAPMILTKLPEETKRNIARDHTSAEWTVLELQAAIHNEVRIFEIGQQTSTLSSQQRNSTATFYTSLHGKPHGKREASNKLTCVFCKGNHIALNCEVHKDVPSCVRSSSSNSFVIIVGLITECPNAI